MTLPRLFAAIGSRLESRVRGVLAARRRRRTTLPPASLIPHVKRAVWNVDPEQSTFDVQTMSERVLAQLPFELVLTFNGLHKYSLA
jgi:hypothetical protein